jgi:hypothetical protein
MSERLPLLQNLLIDQSIEPVEFCHSARETLAQDIMIKYICARMKNPNIFDIDEQEIDYGLFHMLCL